MNDIGAASDVGRVRETNQDRYLTRRQGGTTLLAVADGIGGQPGGDVASAAAVDALASGYDPRAIDPAAALSSALRGVNDAVLRAADERGFPMAGTTVVAAVVRGSHLAVANLGDSRAYLVRDGVARQITADHSGAWPGAITRFAGDPRGVAPDVFVEPLRKRDRVVLCSDGLTAYASPEEIAAAVTSLAPAAAATALVALANGRGGMDNITVVVYEHSGRGSSTALLRIAGLVLVAVVAALILTLAGATTPGPSPQPAPGGSPSASPSPG